MKYIPLLFTTKTYHNSCKNSYFLTTIKAILLSIICFLEIYFFDLIWDRKLITLKIFSASQSTNTLRMWYTKPSTEIPLKDISNKRFHFNRTNDNTIWQQNTLPIGNGYLGANIYGEILTERVTFNEKSLWNGGPSKKRPYYIGGNTKSAGQNGKLFHEIQKLFKEGKDEEAASKCQTLIGDEDIEALGSFQEFGEFQFDFLNTEKKNVFSYIRYLDLNTASTHVSYKYKTKKGDVASFDREFFASYPDNVVCMKFSTTDKMTVNCRFLTPHNGRTTVEQNQITVEGELEDNQMKFNGKLYIVPKDGKVKRKANSILVEDSTEIVMYASAATDYKNKYPLYRSGESAGELNDKVQKIIDAAVKKGYEKVKENHLIDYGTIFDRVDINIGQESPQIPTDELLTLYKSHFTETSEKVDKKSDSEKADEKSDSEKVESQFRYLEVLLFQFGRFLDISSSRAGSLPPNLQGVWNDQTVDVPWAADYHININLQMNYFPTFSTNMAELGPPLLDFIESIQEPGRVTAMIYTGIKSEEGEKNGFMVHHRLNPFGWTAPGWNFKFGWAPSSLLWILHNVFELFLYTNDVSLLRNRIYPLLREEAFYFEKLFVYDDKNNRTITSPASSPEHGPPTNGNTYEQTNVWQHFTNTLMAAKILDVDKEHHQRWQNLIDSFKPIEIGLSGQIKEWYCEGELGSMGEEKHRHMSHLLGLFPYNLIDENRPDWIRAAIVSMNDRGDETTGWGMGQRINAWARVGDGDRAFKLIQYLLKNGIYSNLWDTHPPFQIDGNFGATSGISEMLMQSTFNRLKLLPALPSAWMKSGYFKGLVGKGNIVVDCMWKEGKATEVIIEPRFDAEIEISCKGVGKASVYEKESGKEVKFQFINDEKISIKVNSNCLYLIKF